MRLCRKKNRGSFLFNSVEVMRQSMLLWRLRLSKKQAAYTTSEHRAAAPHCTRKDTKSKNFGHVGAD